VAVTKVAAAWAALLHRIERVRHQPAVERGVDAAAQRQRFGAADR
jgi:hypothetical protein